jgi:nitrogen fixation NifU-like protein
MKNNKDFEDLIKHLQQRIDEEEEATYSKKVIEEYRNPTNFGLLKKSNAIGKVKGPCNDTMKITLSIKNGLIKNARFWTDGCGATIACGSMLMKLVKGKKTDKARIISRDNLIKKLDGLPKEHLHCAKLAVDTLNNAIDYYLNKNKKPRSKS